ncbi:hypothetical protein [Jiangella anatolica]|uniref:Sugar-binding protein n=1 Tax=Jiangella anatolica TaxID=2670374 RepID=A0A2W2C9A2_9ACTN|nr:hypothetical protein [Jiangella anatolica]PZF84689.1 hypothetical protein C1I92_07430 [Jiangella anatolica]
MTRFGTLRLAALLGAGVLLTPLGTAAAQDDASPRPARDRLTWDPGSLASVYQPAPGFYSYAPSVVRDGDTEWIWSCHNDESRVIEDHIYLTTRVDGVVTQTRSVLHASPAPAWDSFHTCDPSVVAGRFHYGGVRYSYAMFYLGNDVDASAHNQVGVAFATDPAGPWVKYPEPIVTSDRVDQWGAGQPTAVSLAGDSGRVLLAYTRGDTSTRAYASVVDLTQAERLRVSPPVLLPADGLVGADGAPDYLNGFDLALDRTGRDVVVVREQHPYPIDNPWWIGPSVQVARISLRDLLAGAGRWQPLGEIDHALTGFTRNHNAGLARTWHGRLADPSGVEVVFTSSCSSLPTIDDPDWSQATCDSLYSYDLWSITGRWTGSAS